MTLSDDMKTAGRDNNFNLLRVVAALSVLVSHSYALALGNAELEPFKTSLGTSLGEMAVDVFFIVSGFLICGSLFSRQDPIRFVTARCLRIYPLLVVVVLISALVLGPLMTTLEPAAYFANKLTWIYIEKNGIAEMGQGHLPGVFLNTPYGPVVNGSLWTLHYELMMYCLIFVFWMIVRYLALSSVFTGRLLILLVAAGFLSRVILSQHIHAQHPGFDNFSKLFAVFFIGAAVWFYRQVVALKTVYAVGAMALLVSSAYSKASFSIIFPFAACYLILFFAFRVRGIISRYNRFGDYSYGVYVFAFPVQQTIVAFLPGIGVARLIFFSSVVTIPLSVLSWIFIESKALSFVPATSSRLHTTLRDLGMRARGAIGMDSR
jgi:peptidoglycan/LPS O-acetylase OafA/YrhL